MMRCRRTPPWAGFVEFMRTAPFTAILFFLFFLPGALAAEIVVLPFRIQGKPDPARFSRTELDRQLQEAVYFLARMAIDYPLTSPIRTARAVERSGWRPDQTLNFRPSRSICLETSALYLLAGEARFLGPGEVRLAMTMFSCHTMKKAAAVRRVGQVNRLQQMLLEMIRESASFARPKPQFPSDGRGNSVDLAVLLDCSGSMTGDLPYIKKSLEALLHRLSGESRLAVIALQGDGRRETLPFTNDRTRIRRFLKRQRAGGENSLRFLVESLNPIAQYQEWRGDPRLLVFSDVRLAGETATLEGMLQRLRNRGIKSYLFPLSGRQGDDLAAWRRLIETISPQTNKLVYARRLEFLEGYSLYLIVKDNRLFETRKEIGRFVLSGKIDRLEAGVVDTYRFSSNALNLQTLPDEYARRNNLHLAGTGPMISNLESLIHSVALGGTERSRSAYRVLLKNEGVGFWIGVNNASVYKRLRDLIGRKIYLGLRFRYSGESEQRIGNDPDFILIRSEGNIPRLFVNSWRRLVRLPSRRITPEDIWFLSVEIKGTQDVRRERDIRR